MRLHRLTQTAHSAALSLDGQFLRRPRRPRFWPNGDTVLIDIFGIVFAVVVLRILLYNYIRFLT